MILRSLLGNFMFSNYSLSCPMLESKQKPSNIGLKCRRYREYLAGRKFNLFSQCIRSVIDLANVK
jgi:hypothetical protein